MSDAFWNTLPATIAALAAAVIALRNGWQARTRAKAAEVEHATTVAAVDGVSAQVEEVRQNVNGQTQELLKVTGEAEKAKGVLQGRDERDR